MQAAAAAGAAELRLFGESGMNEGWVGAINSGGDSTPEADHTGSGGGGGGGEPAPWAPRSFAPAGGCMINPNVGTLPRPPAS
eukprot:COSAG01_NODE_1112_length_11654_cov_8.254435_12_plen_82_part_00